MTAFYIILIIALVLILLQNKHGRKFLHRISGISLILSEIIILTYIFLAIYAFFYAELPTNSLKKLLVPTLGFATIFGLIGISGDLFVKHTKAKIKNKQTGYFLAIAILFLVIVASW